MFLFNEEIEFYYNKYFFISEKVLDKHSLIIKNIISNIYSFIALFFSFHNYIYIEHLIS